MLDASRRNLFCIHIVMMHVKHSSRRHEQPLLGTLIETARRKRASHIFVEEPVDTKMKQVYMEARFARCEELKHFMLDEQFKELGHQELKMVWVNRALQRSSYRASPRYVEEGHPLGPQA